MGNRHIKNYHAAKKIMEDYFKAASQRLENDLKVYESTYGNPDCWDPDLKCYMLVDKTDCSLRHVITKLDVDGLRHRVEVEEPKYVAYWMERLSLADKAPKMIELNIRIEWKRSRTWGSNPHAEAYLFFESEKWGVDSCKGIGHASGCGYDKASAAVSEALGFPTKKKDCAEVKDKAAVARSCLDRFVIEHGEALWKEYAVDKTPLPHLCFGGKGMSTFTRLFRRVGCRPCGEQLEDYLIDYHESARGADVYHVIRKDRI